MLQCWISMFLLLPAHARGQESAEQLKIGNTPVSAILEQLGAKLESGLTASQQADYARAFMSVDQDGDVRHSKEEYIENGRYLTPQLRRGIFNASDSDKDGFVTEAEYILNRIITDEAKAIVQAMDDDEDGTVQSAEFVKHATAKLNDANLAKDVFAAFDTNRNGEILVPEYLQVWGRWARAGRMSAEKRIAKISQRTTDGEPQSPDEERRSGPPVGFGPSSGRGFGPPPNSIFEALDADQDQVISAVEIKNAVAALKTLDANNDGSLTQDEVSPFGRGGGGRPARMGERERRGGFGGRGGGGFGETFGRGDGPPSVDEVFQRMDKNQDGELQKDEVPEFAQDFILPADENSDQSVTKEELMKFRERRPSGGPTRDGPSGRRGPPQG